ncbi:MAG: DUF58 domain-containing protein [Deltaproteobacteria bacterium]|nr:DUF58 domain-containing protein [Deltaproteobacteria bacterium]
MISKELLKKLRRIEIHTSRLANEQLVGNYHSVFKGRGLAFDEVRAYQPGDDVRFIDWNVTARTGDPYVKVFREEREMTVLLAVDASASQRFGTRVATKSDVVAEIAAVIAFSAIKNNDRVGLLLFTDDVERVVPPKKGPRHVMRVVAETLSFQPEGRGTDLARVLDVAGGISRRRAAVFVLSDFVQAESYEHSLRIAAARHDLVPIVISDPREEELVDVGIAYMEDLETGQLVSVDTSNRRVRETFRREAAKQRAAREGLFKRLGLESISVSTATPYIKPLSEFFRRRAARARAA